jgi:nucleoside-diphosphate-sugar epimerase
VEERPVLPLICTPDSIEATLGVTDADLSRRKHHADFNLAGVSFSVRELASKIRKHIPYIEVSYAPDYRQEIADTWPRSVDDFAAREEWGWEPQYDLESLTSDMLDCLRSRYESGGL